jgi:hypothetical protein
MNHASAEALGTFSDHSKDEKERVDREHLTKSLPDLIQLEHENEQEILRQNEPVLFPSKGIDHFEEPYGVLFYESPTSGITVNRQRFPSRSHGVQHDAANGGRDSRMTQSEYSIDSESAQSITLSWTEISVRVGEEKRGSKLKRCFNRCCKPQGSYKKMENGQVRVLKSGEILEHSVLQYSGKIGNSEKRSRLGIVDALDRCE